MSDKQIYIKNKKRSFKASLPSNSYNWSPEHERLSMTPITSVDVSADFINEKQKMRKNVKQGPPVISRQVQERAWLPEEKSYSTGDILYDEVDVPDNNSVVEEQQNINSTLSPPDQPNYFNADLSFIGPGQYCLIFDSKVYAFGSLESLKNVIEEIIKVDSHIRDSDLIIMQRLPVKIGVTIG